MEQASAAAIDGLFMALPQDLKSESVIRMLPLLTEEQRAGVIDKIEQLGHNGLPVKRQRVSTGEDGDEDGKGATESSQSDSKNPNSQEFKDGDWMCPSCGAHNFRNKIACFKCGAPHQARMGHMGGPMQPFGFHPPPPMGGMPHDYGMGGPMMDPNHRPGDWVCPSCGINCYGSKMECFKCGTPKPAHLVGMDSRPGDWACPSCGINVFASKDSCFKCGATKPPGHITPAIGPPSQLTRPGDWTCPSCQAHCFGSRNDCFRCHAPKPAGV